MPFVLAGALRWWTLLPVLLVSYTFFGLEPNDLPLDGMVRTIEREMLSLLGETDLPPALAPSAYVLT